MNFDPNALYYKMVQIYSENKTDKTKVIIGNEGGTRSSKTWDSFHLLYTFCDHNPNRGLEIYILRDTLTHCRDFTFKEFKKCMKLIGANVLYTSQGQKPNAIINGNTIFFRGLDDEDNTEAYPSDILFFNEILETKKTKVDGLIMRCRMLMIMDWNPKYTDHWVFDMEERDDTYFTHTTYKNNIHLEESIISEILGYEPWLPGSYQIIDNEMIYNGKPISDTNQPPPHTTNKKPDEFRWKVYGLGLRGAMTGVIINQLEWIEEFPDIAYTYANDFGFTNDPNALGKYAEDEHNIWFELLIYQPIDTPEELNAAFQAVGVEKYDVIACDSSDKYTGENKGTIEMVRGLRELGYYSVFKISKTKSVMFWLSSMTRKKLHCVKNHLWKKVKKEKENYKFKEINGILINQPIDKWNHVWDMVRYGHMSHNNNKEIEVEWD